MPTLHVPPSCRKSTSKTNPTGPTLPLVLPSAAAPGSLTKAIYQVKDVWRDHPGYAEQSRERYGELLDRFARHAQIIGVSALADVDPAVVTAFANAVGRDRRGHVVKPSGRTVGQRRAAVAAFFASATARGLVLDDPTLLVPVPKRTEGPGIRPLDHEEAINVRYRAGTNPVEVCGVVVALLLAGAHTGELGAVERDHIEPDRTVRLPGSTKFSPRSVAIDAEAASLLAARSAYLIERQPRTVLLCGKGGKPSSQQSRIGTIVRKVLKRSGLGDDPRVKPTSLTAYAARCEFEATGSVEAAAALIGSKSLDSTARLIGHKWNEVSA